MNDIHKICDYVIAMLTEGDVPLNNIKLHKLLYYTYAWWLAFGRPAKSQIEFQAWVHGPVNRAIYSRFRDTKTLYSPMDIDDIQEGFSPDDIPPEERAHIEAVLEVYGELAGDQLEAMTHAELPWINARQGAHPAERCENVISDTDMIACYGARIAA